MTATINPIEPKTKSCSYHGNVGNAICYCHHPEIAVREPAVDVPLLRCETCPLFVLRENLDVRTIQKPATLQDAPCVHLGDLSRKVTCQTCSGSKAFDVHSCDLHSECATSRNQWNRIRQAEHGTKVKNCSTCKDFTSAELPMVETLELIKPEPKPATRQRGIDDSIQLVSLNGTIGSVRPVQDAIRVGVLTPVLAVGGVERWLITLAKSTPGLQWQGCAIHEGGVIDARPLSELSQLMPVSYDRESLLSECDIVLTWAENHAPELLEIPGKVVHTIHGATDWSAWCAKVNADAVTCFVGVSPVASSVAPDGSECVTIPNAIDPSRLVPSAAGAKLRGELGIPAGHTVVGYVGRFSPEKSPLDAARAASEFGGVSVYCSTSERAGWKERILAIDSGAKFLDPSRPADLLTVADLFVMGSRVEGFGLTFAESWYLGTPIVSHTPGIVPVAEELAGRALVTRIDDFPTLADACRAALVNHEQTAAARQIVADNFLPQTMGNRYTALFEAIISP